MLVCGYTWQCCLGWIKLMCNNRVLLPDNLPTIIYHFPWYHWRLAKFGPAKMWWVISCHRPRIEPGCPIWSSCRSDYVVWRLFQGLARKKRVAHPSQGTARREGNKQNPRRFRHAKPVRYSVFVTVIWLTNSSFPPADAIQNLWPYLLVWMNRIIVILAA